MEEEEALLPWIRKRQQLRYVFIYITRNWLEQTRCRKLYYGIRKRWEWKMNDIHHMIKAQTASQFAYPCHMVWSHLLCSLDMKDFEDWFAQDVGCYRWSFYGWLVISVSPLIKDQRLISSRNWKFSLLLRTVRWRWLYYELAGRKTRYFNKNMELDGTAVANNHWIWQPEADGIAKGTNIELVNKCNGCWDQWAGLLFLFVSSRR